MKTKGLALWAAGAALGFCSIYASAATVDCPNQPSAFGPTYIELTFSAPVAATCYDFGQSTEQGSGQYSVVTGQPVVLDNNILELPTGTLDFTPISNFLSGTFDSGTSGDFEFLVGSANPLWLVFKTGGGQNDPYWFAFQLLNVAIGTEVSWELFGGSNGLSNTHLFGSDFVVPLPAAVWLFGSGLLGLLGIARRRKVEVAA